MSIESLARSARTFALHLTTEFRGTTIRSGLLIQGPSGWGEFAPFPEYDDVMAGRWLAGALEAACGSWPTPVRSEIPVNAIIPVLPEGPTRRAVHSAATLMGVTTFKVKVANTPDSLAEDVTRLRTIREMLTELGMPGEIRIDANARWSVSEAATNIAILNEAVGALDYVEQPCATLDELRELKGLMSEWDYPVRIAVDESIRLSESLDVNVIQELADVAIIKAIPVGGVNRALDIVEQIGLPVVVSGSLDTSVGLSSGLALAAAIPNLYGACGLGTGALFAEDVVGETTMPLGGMISLRRTAPDLDVLDQVEAGIARTYRADWQERMIRAWNASASELVSEEVREVVEQC